MNDGRQQRRECRFVLGIRARFRLKGGLCRAIGSKIEGRWHRTHVPVGMREAVKGRVGEQGYGLFILGEMLCLPEHRLDEVPIGCERRVFCHETSESGSAKLDEMDLH